MFYDIQGGMYLIKPSLSRPPCEKKSAISKNSCRAEIMSLTAIYTLLQALVVLCNSVSASPFSILEGPTQQILGHISAEHAPTFNITNFVMQKQCVDKYGKELADLALQEFVLAAERAAKASELFKMDSRYANAFLPDDAKWRAANNAYVKKYLSAVAKAGSSANNIVIACRDDDKDSNGDLLCAPIGQVPAYTERV